MHWAAFMVLLAIVLLWATNAALAAAASQPAGGGEVLYNGIVLPQEWPPALPAAPADPLTPEYLKNPPKRIPIDVGRQLFVDDFLIESTSLSRSCHQAEHYAGNPVVRNNAYSGGLWFDTLDGKIKYWHTGGSAPEHMKAMALSTSTDGIHFEDPNLDVFPPSNSVLVQTMHSTAFIINPYAEDPNKRYVAIYSLTFEPADHCHYWYHYSADGIHWGERHQTNGDCGDRSTAFYNPFRKMWVYSIRHGWVGYRSRRYWEMKDLDTGPYWSTNEIHGPVNFAPYWVGGDSADIRREDVVDSEWTDRGFGITAKPGVDCQLYNLDCVGYESVMLGYFSVWRGQPKGMTKPDNVCVGFSRDGWSWSRPDRRTLYDVCGNYTESGNYMNIQSTAGGCLVMGDKLYMYTGQPGTRLAVLRRDGFISMDAGNDGGDLVTRPVTFTGKHLFVNVAAAKGELRVAVLDEAGQSLSGYGRDDCQPIHADKTLQMISWRGGDDLSAFAGKPVRFRFELTDGQLYAFWVSPDKSGASRGYSGAGGGPGFTDATDTVGIANYAAATPPPPAGTAPAALLWPRDGSYTGGVTIAAEVPLCNAVAGATIRYTTDGSDPSESSPAYEKPFTLAEAGKFTVKARVFAAGRKPSAVAEGAFEIRHDSKTPVLFMGGPTGDLPGGTESVTVHIRTGESAICRYSHRPDQPYDQMSGVMAFEGHALHETRKDLPGGTLHTLKIEGLKDGDFRRLYIKARDAYGNTSEKDYEVSFTVNADKPQPVEVRLEAESGILEAPMQVMKHIDAIGGLYVGSAEAEKGSVTFTFEVPVAGKYLVWARVLTPKRPADAEQNAAQETPAPRHSFYVNLDGKEDVFDLTQDGKPLKEWTKVVVNGREGTDTAFLVNPRIFTLGEGKHTLIFRSHEPGAMLDWVTVTNQVK